MGARGRRDDDRFRGVESGVHRRCDGRADFVRDLGGTGGVDVGDQERVDAGGGAEEAGVEPADAPGTEERDPHAEPPVPSRRNVDASTRRPMAALSDGGAQVVSCSTISQPA